MDQAEKLRQISQNLEFVLSRVIAVTSGKGGCSKTNLVANLGICLPRRLQGILLDADLGTANLDVLLGMFTEYSLYEVIRDTDLG